MRIAKLRVEYRAATEAALGVAVLATVLLSASFVITDFSLTAVSAFVGAFTSASGVFAIFFAFERAAVRRHLGRPAIVVPPTLATRAGILKEDRRLAPPHAIREPDVETMHRHVWIALPAVVGFAIGVGVGPVVSLAGDGGTSTSLFPTAAGWVAGHATGLALVHFLCERWAMRWERRTGLVLLRGMEGSPRRGTDRIYAEVPGAAV